jgi:mRNA-degrading endonuclease RelE of RelBE toxin-antitoxin system
VDVKWHPEAEKEFLELDKTIQEKVRKEKNKLAEKGLEHGKIGPIFDPELGLEAFKLRIDKGKANHRIIFDVKNSSFIIYKIGRRDGFYSQENLEEVKKRK